MVESISIIKRSCVTSNVLGFKIQHTIYKVYLILDYDLYNGIFFEATRVNVDSPVTLIMNNYKFEHQ